MTDIESKLVEAQRAFGTAQARIKKLEKTVEELDARVGQGKLDELAAEVEAEKSYIERKKKLQDTLREEESKLAETEQELRVADKKFQEDLKGVQGGYVKRIEAEESGNKVKLLEIRLGNSREKIKALREELRTLPAEYLRSKKAEVVEKAAEQRDQLKATETFLSQVKTSLANKRTEMQQLLDVLGEAEEKEKRVKELEAERLQYENQLVALRQLRTSEVSEVKVLTAAVPATDAVSSSFRKIAAAAFAVAMLLLFGLLIAGDLLAQAGTAEGPAERLGLPVLARGGSAAARGLALRLRQYVPESGGLILVSPLDEGGEVEDLVGDVSRYLAMQDEKVLIVDARIARSQGRHQPPWVDPLAAPGLSQATMADLGRGEPGTAGLVQYLVFEGQDPNAFVWPTRFPAVEYLPSGGPCSTTDVLASQPMRELLAGLRQRYSLILLIGPAVYHSAIDTEILAGHASGMLVLINGPTAGAGPGLHGFVQSLKEANAPLLGCVLGEE